MLHFTQFASGKGYVRSIRFPARLCTFPLILSCCLSLQAQVTVNFTSGVPTGTAMNGVAYGNSIYVAVGAGGNLLKSANGVNFVPAQTAATFLNTAYSHVAFGGGLFVAVSQDGYIASSADGLTWTQRTSAGATNLSSVLYAGGQWITVGNNGFAATSPDGISWTSINTGGVSGDYFANVVYTGGKYVIGERDGATSAAYVLYSSTGAGGTWTRATVSASNVNSLNMIEVLNGTLYVFTTSGAIFTSADITTWSAFSYTGITTSGNQMFDGLYAGGVYYLFGNTSAIGYCSVFSSPDGSTWTLQAKKTAITVQHVITANGLYYILGNEGLVYSSDGVGWVFTDGSYLGLASSGSLFVAVGQTTSTEDAIFTSSDFSTWTNRSQAGLRPLNGVTYGNGKYVAVGNTDPSTTFSNLATSSDGITWTGGNTGIVNNLRTVVYGNGKYVAAGLNGQIVYSSDGTSWSSAETGAGYNYYGVAYLNSYFVAVGGSTTPTTGKTKVKYSSNGVTWVDVSPNVVGHFQAIAYGSGKYVLVGRDNTTGSLKFFSMTTTDITNISAWSATSAAVTPAVNIGSAGFGGAAFGNGQFVAIGNLNLTPFTGYILSSTDGVSWTATSSNTTSRLRGVVYNASNDFKAVGLGSGRLDITAGTPLPLILLSFTGRNSGEDNILSWQTSDEIETREFVIESSGDGTVFGAAGTVAAAGNNFGILQYSYTEARVAAGRTFYRLKMIDLDGHFSYSNIITLTANTNQARISIWPNPLGGENLTIGVPQATTLPLVFTIYNEEGKALVQGLLTEPSQQVEVSRLGAGHYTVRFSNGTVRPFVKL